VADWLPLLDTLARDMPRFGRLDPRTGMICGIIVGPLVSRREAGYPERNPDNLGTNSDECHASAAGGDWVYWFHNSTLTNAMGKNVMYNVRTHEVVYVLFDENRFARAPRIPVSVSDSRAMATGMRSGYNGASNYTGAAVWRNMLFRQTGGRVVALRGKEVAG